MAISRLFIYRKYSIIVLLILIESSGGKGPMKLQQPFVRKGAKSDGNLPTDGRSLSVGEGFF